MPSKILAFAGSLRKDSFNKKLARLAAEGAKKAGAQVTYLDLKEYPLPLFDQDIEDQGPPENLVKLRKMFHDHQGFLISSPEYNSSFSAVLKNTLDWLSREPATEDGLEPLEGKVVALYGASPGAFGAIRGLQQIRNVIQNLNMLVVPGPVLVPKAAEAFDENGALKNPKQAAAVDKLAASLVQYVGKLSS